MNELFKEFQLFRRILCVCPCCRGLARISDLRLKAKGSAIQTWLDGYEEKERRLAKKEETFKEEEEKFRELAREKGRKASEEIFNAAICPSLRALKLDPFDVKPILHPIDFVVFNGMNKQEAISEILLLTRPYNCPSLNSIGGQIKAAVSMKRYEWQVARINENGAIILE